MDRATAIWFSLAAVVLIASAAALWALRGTYSEPVQEKPAEAVTVPQSAELPEAGATATFAGGCFWCTEAVFQQLKGVTSVVSGYIGGAVPNPTYREVCSGITGHAEAVQITYNPKMAPYETLLEVFWRTHDPTTLNRQGNDTGTQYRSVIFYHSAEQKRLAEHYKEKLAAAGLFAGPIVTEIVPASTFYPAEAYHQNYFAENSAKPYCRFVIGPKIDKLKKVFQDKLQGDK